MSVHRPQRRYGWPAAIQVGSRVRYKRGAEYDWRDAGYALDDEDLVLPDGEILGQVVEAPEPDRNMNGVWLVYWDNVCWSDGDPLDTWWTLEALLELV